MIIFESILTIFEAAGAVLKISSRLRITNFNQVKLAQFRETYCRYINLYLPKYNQPWNKIEAAATNKQTNTQQCIQQT